MVFIQPRRQKWYVPVVAGLLVLVTCGTALQAQLVREIDETKGLKINQNLNSQLPLQTMFTDEKGNKVALGAYFRGDKPVIITPVYYRCPKVCGVVLQELVRGIRELQFTPGQEYEIVTFSFNPRETHTLAKLNKQGYIKLLERPEAAAGWHFLTGSQESIAAVTSSLGFEYAYLEDTGEYAHPVSIMVCTPDGRISRYLMEFPFVPKTLRLSLVEASEGRIGSPVDSFLLFCFQYDHTRGRYAAHAMNIMRAGGALTLAVLAIGLLSLWRARRNDQPHTAEQSQAAVDGADSSSEPDSTEGHARE